MDAKIRKLMTCHRMHHPRADIERLYIKRENSGRGLIQLEFAYKTLFTNPSARAGYDKRSILSGV